MIFNASDGKILGTYNGILFNLSLIKDLFLH
jgi:hypothetical protein